MDSAVIELKNIDVQWRKDDAFCKYFLYIIKIKTNNTQCGNPWNHMDADEIVYVNSLRPLAPKTCDIDTMLYNKIISLLNLKTDIQSELGADVWGLFYTNMDRTEPPTVYFDHRKYPNYDVKENIRNILINDATELVDLISNGKTVVIVFGGEEFIEVYYSLIGGVVVKSTVDHTL